MLCRKPGICRRLLFGVVYNIWSMLCYVLDMLQNTIVIHQAPSQFGVSSYLLTAGRGEWKVDSGVGSGWSDKRGVGWRAQTGCLRRTGFGVRWTPHPVIVTIGDNRNYVRVLLYSYYTTITG